jgi:hypothetical protein
VDVKTLGTAGLNGWRAKVGDAVAGPVARHSAADAEQVRAAVGLLFLVLSLLYVGKTLKRVAARA